MTPSAVSKLIGRLEDRLGARLINRTTRRLQLTPEGAAFYENGLRILAEIEAAEQEAAAGAVPRGRLQGELQRALRPALSAAAAAEIPGTASGDRRSTSR